MRRSILAGSGLAMLAACGYTPAPEVKDTKETMVTIVAAINAYKKDMAKTPAKLAVLMEKPPASSPEAKKWKGPYLKEIPKDAWGKDFVYTVPGRAGLQFDLVSLGEDGKWGGKKDAQEIAFDDKSLPTKK